MKELYGFKEKDIIGLVEFLKSKQYQPLSKVFESYAAFSGKEKGTIRNLYYTAAKRCKIDKEFCKKYFNGKQPKIGSITTFTKEETADIVKKILLKKNEGKSVRCAVNELSHGDIKLALRYQNKYRNAMNNKELVGELKTQGFKVIQGGDERNLEKLKNGVNNLVEKISLNLRRENELLKERVSELQLENLRLSDKLFGGGKEG